MARRKSHVFDEVADEVLRELQDDTEWYIEQLRGDTRAPFTADVSEADKLDFYRRQMYMENPDGSIDYTKMNASGRQQLIQSLGTKGYAQVAMSVKPPKGMEMMTGRDEDYDLTDEAGEPSE